MALYAESGIFNAIVGVVIPSAQLTATVGNIYVASGGGGGSTTITSSDNTIGVTGSSAAYNLIIAAQGATPGQVLTYNGVKWIPSAAGGFTLQVDGAPVSAVAGAVNLQDSTAVRNRVQFANTSTNNVQANLDPLSPILTTELSIGNSNNSQSITLDYPTSAASSYRAVFPGAQATASNQTLLNDGTGNLAWGTVYGTVQNASGVAVAQRPTVSFTGSGVTSVVDDLANNRTVVTITGGGGGGGGTFTSTAIWTGGTANKDAQTSPGNINNQGITINLVASSGAGQITSATVSLNGIPITGTFDSTGTFPNLSIVIPVATITGLAAQTASSVAVSVVGIYAASNVNVSNAGTLTNTQPTAFATTLSGSYNAASLPFYTTTATLNYSYTNSGAITSFGGVLTPTNTPLLPRNATSPTGSFVNVDAGGITISGSAIGTGINGAGSRTVTLSGLVAAVPSYTPAFYVQTANATIPVFTTASTQTPGSQINAVINYPAAIATTQYNWVATTQPVSRVFYVSPLGNSQIVPDSTSTAVISGVTFNIFGLTALTVGSVASILITA